MTESDKQRSDQSANPAQDFSNLSVNPSQDIGNNYLPAAYSNAGQSVNPSQELDPASPQKAFAQMSQQPPFQALDQSQLQRAEDAKKQDRQSSE